MYSADNHQSEGSLTRITESQESVHLYGWAGDSAIMERPAGGLSGWLSAPLSTTAGHFTSGPLKGGR